MDITIRPITSDEVSRFRQVLSQAFGGDASEDGDDRFREQVDLSRTYAVFDGERLVGTAASFTFDVSIPGGAVPMGGLTMVSVRPTHRRRGILRWIIEAHFADVKSRNEPLSGLWASETMIYGRFGYGDAVARHNLSVNVTRAALRSVESADVVQIVDTEEAEQVVPGLYELHRLGRPGMLSRSEPWWRVRRFYDGSEIRDGASSRRHAIAFRDGEPVGYVAYRQKKKWSDWLPDGETRVIELVGDASTRIALWSFLLSIDLFPNISWWNAPVDDPVKWMVGNHRAVTAKLADSLWIRLMDVDRCLEMRRYRRPGRIVLGVTDATITENAGNHELTIDEQGGATSRRTTDPADVELDVAALGTLYMGGRNAVELTAAGLITGRTEDIRRLDELMAWDAPWCPEVF